MFIVILIISEHSVEHKEIGRQEYDYVMLSAIPHFTGLDTAQPTPPVKGGGGHLEKDR